MSSLVRNQRTNAVQAPVVLCLAVARLWGAAGAAVAVCDACAAAGRSPDELLLRLAAATSSDGRLPLLWAVLRRDICGLPAWPASATVVKLPMRDEVRLRWAYFSSLARSFSSKRRRAWRTCSWRLDVSTSLRDRRRKWLMSREWRRGDGDEPVMVVDKRDEGSSMTVAPPVLVLPLPPSWMSDRRVGCWCRVLMLPGVGGVSAVREPERRPWASEGRTYEALRCEWGSVGRVPKRGVLVPVVVPVGVAEPEGKPSMVKLLRAPSRRTTSQLMRRRASRASS